MAWYTTWKQKQNMKKNAKPLPTRQGMIKDETGSIEIALFSSLVD